MKSFWYDGDTGEVYHHYSSTRYHALNLHSYFADGHWEMRAANSTLHAGVIRSYIVLALAISNAALTKSIVRRKFLRVIIFDIAVVFGLLILG